MPPDDDVEQLAHFFCQEVLISIDMPTGERPHAGEHTSAVWARNDYAPDACAGNRPIDPILVSSNGIGPGDRVFEVEKCLFFWHKPIRPGWHRHVTNLVPAR
jgi:hypothetical protein